MLARWFVRFLTAGLCLTSAGNLLAEEPFDYFSNSYSVIGLKDYREGSRVTPENEVLLARGAKAVIRYGTSDTPLDHRQTKTLVEGWLPIVLLSACEGGIRYELTLWATPLPTVKDWKKAFDWPTEGENFLDWIQVKVTNTGTATAKARVKIQQPGRQAPAIEMAWSVAPGATARGVARIAFEPVVPAAFDREPAELWLQRTMDFWRGRVLSAARIEVPCRKATEALLAAHVCQLIANDHGELHGGEGFYDHFYIRDGAYQLMELEEAGLADVAAKAVDAYLRHQRPDGRFESQSNQFDANGQALWVLWQYAKISGDRTWLAGAYPQMRQAVAWLEKARRLAPADSPFAGLLPCAPADGEYLWDGKHHIVGYDLWNLRGLECTADAARMLGKPAEADALAAEASDYRRAIAAACRRTGLAHFPPSWEQAGTHWGNTETLWPTELFDRSDPRVAATIRHARREHGGGFIEGTIQWLGMKDAIHPYMSAYTTMASLVRGEHDAVVEDFYWYLLHCSATHAFPEGIFYKRRFAWSDTIPHVTGASNYALMLRHMLLHEAGGELHLLAAVPDGWLAPGQRIVVQRAPTHFGPLDFTVAGTAAGVRVSLNPPRRQPPAKIVLHLPQGRPLVGSLAGVQVVVRADQKTRWDFPTVVKLYQQSAAAQGKPAPAATAPKSAAAPRDRQARPNVIFILIDDLGWTDVGCFGSDLYRTPNVDRLAREGMRFTNAYSACTVCSPTRASVMTGKYPARLHLTDWIAGHERPYARLRIPAWTKQLPLEEVTIAEALKGAGYVTAHVGKWHLGPRGFWPTDQGFDVNVAGCDLGQPPSYYWPYKQGAREIPTLELTPKTRGQYLTDRLADEAVRLVREFRNRPFFLYLATYQVHMPKQPKPEYVPAYESRVKPGMKHTDARYAAMVQSMDELVGKVLHALDELGIADHTMVIFTGDNGGLSHLFGEKRGPTDNAPLRLGKGSAYEGGVRVPLVVRWPGKTTPASVCREPVASIDYYPTILQAAGAKGDPRHNAQVDGRSLVPILEQPAATLGRDAIYWHYPHYHPGGATPYGAIRSGPWKLIEFYEDMHTELYNLADDIGESRDLAAQKPEIVEQLRNRLHAWRQSVGAQMPTPNPNYDAAKDRARIAPKAKPKPKAKSASGA